MKQSAILGCLVMLFTSIAWAEGRCQDRLHELGGPLIVYRQPVQKELKLSDAQKRILQQRCPTSFRNRRSLEKLQNLNAGERDAQMQSYRRKLGEKMWPLLKQTLNAGQFKRFQQLELQHEGSAGLGRPRS